MKAWRVHAYGDPAQVMRLDDVPEPRPAAGQVLLRMRAAAVDFADSLLCRGLYQERPERPFVPGMEMCAEVVEAGTGTGLQSGERVIAHALPVHSYAELACVDARSVRSAPENLDDAEAAAFHFSYQTSWFALHRRAALRAGETLLVHAAAGGVGSAAVQLGKAAGARVIGVVGGPKKVETALGLGCDVVIDRTSQDVIAAVKAATAGRGADVVYDPVGGPAYHQSSKVVAFEGRIVVVGFASGEVPTPALGHLLVKNYSVLGLYWGQYERREPTAVDHGHAELSRLAREGVIRPLVSERLPFTQAADAVQRVAEGRTTGRVVVMPD
ncbi:Quinone oxidoreductase 1 [Streptomyces sp. YIM 130001]|uniref:NADPH:quinone oxidoreductase family protein n=1 Tax=Streptomyces sp. YIM 130001 TaxID=2259644 RepID=UPI000E6519DC|nr:NADPH:quinone oxidoreductase family protein [Streptomyces sp. YIM 130001]RII11159.1 Quinone oxidoreductase 1 [Streptomyces sp. YIM 130001]